MGSVGALLHPCSRQCSRLQASQTMCSRTNTSSRCTAVSGPAWPSCVLRLLAPCQPRELHTTRQATSNVPDGCADQAISCFLLLESRCLLMPAG